MKIYICHPANATPNAAKSRVFIDAKPTSEWTALAILDLDPPSGLLDKLAEEIAAQSVKCDAAFGSPIEESAPMVLALLVHILDLSQFRRTPYGRFERIFPTEEWLETTRRHLPSFIGACQ